MCSAASLARSSQGLIPLAGPGQGMGRAGRQLQARAAVGRSSRSAVRQRGGEGGAISLSTRHRAPVPVRGKALWFSSHLVWEVLGRKGDGGAEMQEQGVREEK